ncbi:hypothetical protein C8Q75DRAFT_783922 [Abortiporus biennis]|nr:hypothetical protein C8Q75DRAFT_783922 [Abortiporus biennis]
MAQSLATVLKSKLSSSVQDRFSSETTRLLANVAGHADDASATDSEPAPKLSLSSLSRPLSSRIFSAANTDSAYLPIVEESIDDDKHDNPLRSLLTELYVLLSRCIPPLWTRIQEQATLGIPVISTSHLSTVSAAATSIAMVISKLTCYGIISGFSSALDTQLSANNTRSAAFWCFLTAIILSVTLMPTVGLWACIEEMLIRCGSHEEVAHLVSVNLHLTLLGIPAYTLNEILKRYLSAQGRSAMYSTLVTFSTTLNCMLNYALVLGPPSIKLGFIGAPIAGVASTNLMALLLLVYVLLTRRSVRSNTFPGSSPSLLNEVTTFVGSGLRGVVKNSSIFLTTDMLGLSVSMLGPHAFTAEAILLLTVSTIYQLPHGVTEFFAKRVTVLLRDGRRKRVKIAILSSALILAILLACIWSLPRPLIDNWIAIFSSDADVIAYIQPVLPITFTYVILQGVGAYVDAILGILGKPMLFSTLVLSSDNLIAIPLGLWLAFGRGWGLYGIWTGLVASHLYSVLIASGVIVLCLFMPLR